MTYDDWKLETPEEEDYSLGAAGRKRRNRAEYEEEHADDLREEEDRRRKQETEYWHDVNADHAPGKPCAHCNAEMRAIDSLMEGL